MLQYWYLVLGDALLFAFVKSVIAIKENWRRHFLEHIPDAALILLIIFAGICFFLSGFDRIDFLGASCSRFSLTVAKKTPGVIKSSWISRWANGMHPFQDAGSWTWDDYTACTPF